MKTDEILQKDVSNALKWKSPISISNIIVISNDGVVTLTGVVRII
jgi:osmotically-inducible protein OsmY